MYFPRFVQGTIRDFFNNIACSLTIRIPMVYSAPLDRAKPGLGEVLALLLLGMIRSPRNAKRAGNRDTGGLRSRFLYGRIAW